LIEKGRGGRGVGGKRVEGKRELSGDRQKGDARRRRRGKCTEIKVRQRKKVKK
jgi:hypothetical protein